MMTVMSTLRSSNKYHVLFLLEKCGIRIDGNSGILAVKVKTKEPVPAPRHQLRTIDL